MNKKRLEMHLIQQKIAPCPWCGEKPIPHMEYGSRFVAECLNEDCPVRPVSKPFSERQEAADAWNSMMFPRWIPVAERLPDECGTYLVVVKFKFDHKTEYDYGADIAGYYPLDTDGHIDALWGTSNDWDDGKQFIRITHWMPIPELPKEDECESKHTKP